MKKFQGRMWIGAAIVCLAASSCAAQQEGPGQNPAGRGAMPMRDPGQHGDPHAMAGIAERQARLHDRLKLNAAQEAAWKEFAAAMAPDQAGSRPQRERFDQLSAPERMERMLAMMKEREAQMTAHLAAVKKFYAVLTPEQQKIFNADFGPGPHLDPHSGPDHAAEHRIPR